MSKQQQGTKKQIVAPQASGGMKVTEVEEDAPMPGDDNSAAHRRALARAAERQQFVTIAERIAKDSMHYKHYKWPGADREFPESIDAPMRFVSKYFPYAEGGPLYVDEPKTALEARRCAEKAELFKKWKMRYVIINDNYVIEKDQQVTNVPAATLESCLEQLEAVA